MSTLTETELNLLYPFLESGKPLTPRQRRGMVTDWLWRNAKDPRAPFTTLVVMEESGAYRGLTGRWDKCHADLNALHRNQVVVLHPGRPARWETARS